MIDTKTKTPEIRAHVIKSCFRCGSDFPAKGTERVCWKCRKPKRSSRDVHRGPLTFRESQIVDLVAQGKANKEIAFTLILTEGTIKEYLNRIFRKVQVSNRTELAVWVLTRRGPKENASFQGQTAFENRSHVN